MCKNYRVEVDVKTNAGCPVHEVEYFQDKTLAESFAGLYRDLYQRKADDANSSITVEEFEFSTKWDYPNLKSGDAQ